MAQNNRPRRSMLYMPGANARALVKGRSLAADALILDLEDSVAPDAKELARQQIVAAIGEGGYGQRELIVRVNALDSPWGQADVAAIAACGADAILLPKVESAAMVQELQRRMNDAGAPDNVTIMCMMETPLGILRAEEIATASPRLSCLVLGTSDLVKDLHAKHTADRLPVLYSLSMCVLAARAHGLAVVDGVHLDLSDHEGFVASCKQGRELGFDGKTLIHPKTIAAANEAFAPSEDEVAWSKKIIAAHAEATAEGKGVVVVNGKLIENLHVEAAHRQVALAEAIAAMAV